MRSSILPPRDFCGLALLAFPAFSSHALRSQKLGRLFLRMNKAAPRFQHVTITFPPGQEARLRGFYVEVLGFREKPVPKVVKPLGWIWFDTGLTGVELHCVPDGEPVPSDTRHHFCLDIDDLKFQREALVEAGYKIVDARPLPFRPRFFARDPFNNLIEFVHVERDYIAAGEGAD
jgi:catechol 2,3-dioxygenase-like lactoylglutathione lyase family enzyme